MSSRWFIPMSLAGFAVVVGGLRMYLSGTRETAPSSVVRRPIDTLSDPEFQRLVERNTSGERSQGDGPDSTRSMFAAAKRSQAARHGPSGLATMKMAGSELADRLDDASVRLRNETGGSATAQLVAGDAALRAGRFVEALKHFDHATTKSPKNIAAMSGRAAALAGLGRFAEGEALYAKVIALAPDDAAAHYNYGVLLYRQAKLGEAAEEFREVVRLDPDHAQARYNLATLAQREGRLAEAREAWEAFTRLRPQVAGGWFNLGVMWMDYDQPERAEQCFARFTELRPTDPDGYVNLGLAEGLSGYLDAALAAMETADTISPCDATVMGYLAELHDAIGERDGADAERHRAIAAALRQAIDNSGHGGKRVETVAAAKNNP